MNEIKKINYDKENIFAKILRGEVPCFKVYEDEKTLAFMDAMPQAKGHILVVPKTEAVTFTDLPEEFFIPIMKTINFVISAIKKSLNVDGVILMQLNGQNAGQSVNHLHFHLIPEHIKNLKQHALDLADEEELKLLAEKIKSAL